MRGVFLDTDTLNPTDLDIRPLTSSLTTFQCYANSQPSEVLERIANANIVVTNKVSLGADSLASAPQLKLICVAATGTNNVDLAAAARLGIIVCNCQAYATASVVQHVFALLLALFTRLPDYQNAVTGGRWQKAQQFCMLDYPIRELAGKTLGIIGYGELGKGVAQLAEAFAMNVLICQHANTLEPEEDRIPLPSLLPQVDVLTIHCPLTPATQGLIGKWELALMRRDAVLINTARGGIVDETALARALRQGALGGAGVDVLSEEPPVDGNPLLDGSIPNLIITPHCAWGSRESRQRLIGQLVENIQAFLTGHPLRVVT